MSVTLMIVATNVAIFCRTAATMSDRALEIVGGSRDPAAVVRLHSHHGRTTRRAQSSMYTGGSAASPSHCASPLVPRSFFFW